MYELRGWDMDDMNFGPQVRRVVVCRRSSFAKKGSRREASTKRSNGSGSLGRTPTFYQPTTSYCSSKS